MGANPLGGAGKLTLPDDGGTEGVLPALTAGDNPSADEVNVVDGTVGALSLPPPQADKQATNVIKMGGSNECIFFMSIPRFFERAKRRTRRDVFDASGGEPRQHGNKTNSHK